MSQKKKNTRLTTPTVRAEFPYLNKPDTQFNPDGEYKVNGLISREQAQDFLAKIDEEVDAHYNAVYNKANAKKKKKLIKHYPYEDKLDPETEEPTGEVRIKTKLPAKIKKDDGEEVHLEPRLFDKKGNTLDINNDFIRMNSLIRIAVELRPYSINSTGMTGITLQLKAVQVREFASGASAESFGFDTEEDEGDDVPEAPAGDDDNDEDEDQGDF